MEIVRLYLLPAVLVLGAGGLAAAEIRTLRTERCAGRPRWVRFARRLGGASVVAILAFMLRAAWPHDTGLHAVEKASYYWLSVVSLAFLVICLALWDVLDSLRTLRMHLESEAREEWEALQARLKAEGTPFKRP